MKNVLVIADDFTGAAEIAGIGHRCGLPTRILRQPTSRVAIGLTVLDTDSRLLAPEEAAETVLRFVEPLRAEPFDLVFKKTDSVLRGPVAAELEALALTLRRPCALLVPQNPSRDRVIVRGEYFINCVPLHHTAFANDPTHPARTSKASELLEPCRLPITIPDAESIADLRECAALAAGDAPGPLPAGGADFFTALLEARGLTPVRQPLDALPAGPRLYVCGSPQPYPFIPNVTARPMMSPDVWRDAIVGLLRSGYDAMMTIDEPLDPAPGAGRLIEQRVATVAAAALRGCTVRTVFATGGATASAVCRAMDWCDFEVDGELAPGVVQLRPEEAPGTSLIVKPGSYAWPAQVGGKGLVSRSTLRGRRGGA